VAHYDSLVQKIDDHGKQDTVSHSGFTARLDGISHRLDLKEGEALGSKDTKGDSRATWAIAIAVATVIVQGYSFVVGHASSSTPASPQVIYVPAAPGTLVPGPQTQPPTR
jgi:hypothetical protein